MPLFWRLAQSRFNMLETGNTSYYTRHQRRKTLFQLSIQLNGSDIMGSPFTVENYDRIAISSTATTTMTVMAALAMVVIAVLMAFVYRYREQKALKSSAPMFIQLMLIGSLLGISSVFALSSQSASSCDLFIFLLGGGFVVLLGSLYVKTWRLMIIFKNSKMKPITVTNSELLFYLGLLCVEVVFNVL